MIGKRWCFIYGELLSLKRFALGESSFVTDRHPHHPPDSNLIVELIPPLSISPKRLRPSDDLVRGIQDLPLGAISLSAHIERHDQPRFQIHLVNLVADGRNHLLSRHDHFVAVLRIS